jgi:thioester reductase-like protein
MPQVVPGDLTLPKLGMSDANHAEVCAEATAVIHSAASVNLNPHIHSALLHNYVATRNMLDMAASMRGWVGGRTRQLSA